MANLIHDLRALHPSGANNFLCGSLQPADPCETTQAGDISMDMCWTIHTVLGGGDCVANLADMVNAPNHAFESGPPSAAAQRER